MKGEVLIPCLLAGATLLSLVFKSFPRESIFSLAALVLPLMGVVDSEAVFQALINPWMGSIVILAVIEKKSSRPFFHKSSPTFSSFPCAPLLDLFTAHLFFSGLTHTSWITAFKPVTAIYAIPIFLVLGQVIGKWFPATIFFSFLFAKDF